MRIAVTTSALLMALGATTTMVEVSSFTPTHLPSISFIGQPQLQARTSVSPLFAVPHDDPATVTEDEVERLRTMAQRLRAEAAALEAERAEQLTQEARSAFQKFDTDRDGEISLEELKAGLEKVFKQEFPQDRVQTLLEGLDVSGDGKLQMEEFVGVDKFRNQLETMARDEKRQALEAKKRAQKEQEMAEVAETALNMINDREPTTRDKIVSVLPYLLPLLDNLQFGKAILTENSDNPVVMALGALYALYLSVPLSGFLSFLALSVFSSNPEINRLVRFNMQQAIFLDIALFFPGLLGLAATLTGLPIPPSVSELGSEVVFGALLLTLAYTTTSSLLGITPDKIPFLSQAVEDRMITKSDFLDENGNLLFPPRSEMEDKDNKPKL